jgi:hypothetical protein
VRTYRVGPATGRHTTQPHNLFVKANGYPCGKLIPEVGPETPKTGRETKIENYESDIRLVTYTFQHSQLTEINFVVGFFSKPAAYKHS